MPRASGKRLGLFWFSTTYKGGPALTFTAFDTRSYLAVPKFELPTINFLNSTTTIHILVYNCLYSSTACSQFRTSNLHSHWRTRLHPVQWHPAPYAQSRQQHTHSHSSNHIRVPPPTDMSLQMAVSMTTAAMVTTAARRTARTLLHRSFFWSNHKRLPQEMDMDLRKSQTSYTSWLTR